MSRAERRVITFKTVFYGLIGVGSILYYGQVGSQLVGQFYFGHALPDYFHYSIMALLSVLTLTAIGCSVHIQALGGFERGELKRELISGLSELRSLKGLAEEAISELDQVRPRQAQGLSTRGEEALRVLRQVIHALDKRIARVETLGSTGRMGELCDAVDILRRKLRSSESAQDSLIDIDPFPAIPANRLSQVIEGLVGELKSGFRKAA